MLPAIADLNRTESFRADGFRSMVDWLVGVCHVSTARARLLVDAATDGAERPELAEALADGRVTLDVFAPLASIATPETDAELAREAEDWTPRQARQLAREVRGTSGSEAAETFRGRFLRFNEEKHSVYAQLTPDTFALVKSAILRRAVRHDHPSSFDPDYEPLETRCADALVDICVEQGGRAGGPTPARPARRPSKPVPPDDQDETPEAAESAEPAEPAEAAELVIHGSGQTQVIVHCDLDRLLHGDGYGSASIQDAGPISVETVRRLACDAQITLSFDTPEGSVLDQKPLKRDPTEAQKIELRRRDRGCRFPGCPCRNVTNAHHMVWASKQGPTVMSNLLTLCITHHAKVHELGWIVDGNANGEVRFTSPSGQVLVSVPHPTWRRRRRE
ncbi:MAG TPA: DUF222 domain-containing protein [Acidimicrobiales bacterium]|nr:DUF222 domain-containing protein [Acidimicrobiales bacterium]